jgi:hypothetical protein
LEQLDIEKVRGYSEIVESNLVFWTKQSSCEKTAFESFAAEMQGPK